MEAYDKLLEKYRENAILGSIYYTMAWDTYTSLPAGAVSQRGEQNAALGQILHRMETEEEIGRLLNEIEVDTRYDAFTKVQKRNVYLMRREYDMNTKLPEEFVGRWLKQRTITNNAREKALVKKDWSIFEPEFKIMFDIMVQKSEYLMDVVGVDNLYDVNIDWFEPGMRADYISKVFDELGAHLPSLIKKYASASEDAKIDFLKRRVEKETQTKIIEALAEFVGYDLNSENAIGKLGESVHPMQFGSYDDVRIALDYRKEDFLFASIAFLHESGHALYNINLNREWMHQPVGGSGGFGVHESQSRFLENMVGLSPEFIGYFLPKLNEITHNQFADISIEEFACAVNLVKPRKIRVASDELTYNLHIIIRFEIERDLFAGKLKVSEIPVVWNELYEKYLGVTVENDAEGALQDLHWGVGQFGHFPMYTLGNIFSAQLAKAMTQQIPDWKEQIGRGEASAVIGWMTQNIHKKGRLYDASELIEHVTGEKISSQPYIDYLKDKFSNLYG